MNQLEQDDERPALLVSYWYRRGFFKNIGKIKRRFFVLDSGAFTAWQQKAEIRLAEYIRFCLYWQKAAPDLKEIYALDVVGDCKASQRNAELMWEAGVEAIPCFHLGEPFDVLQSMAANYPKVALGGAVGQKDRLKWARKCFDLVYPKPIHGFGFGGQEEVLALPWASVDAASWHVRTLAFGRSDRFKGFKLARQAGRKIDLSADLERYLRLEKLARAHWRKEADIKLDYYLGFASDYGAMLSTSLLQADK